MMFRRLQPLDLFALRQAYGGLPNEAQTLDRLNQSPGWVGNMASLVGTWWPLGRRRQAWVVAPKGRLRGLVVVRPRSGPSVWEIERLAAAEPEDLGPELLEHLVMTAGASEVQRLFLRLPEDSPWCDVAQQAGFAPFVHEALYMGARNTWVMPPSLPLRPRAPGDDVGLFRLYCLVVPAAVRQALGLTTQEWQESREWPSKRGHEMVTEGNGNTLGWLRLTAWGRARDFGVLSHPVKGDLEGLVAHALAGCPPRFAVSCLVPRYQSDLARLLEERSFVCTTRYVSLVRMVALRSSRPCLLPAQA